MFPKRLLFAVVLGAILIGALGVFYVGERGVAPATLAPTAIEQTNETGAPITPLPLEIPIDVRKVALGRKLFHDPRLSGDGSISCASCHKLTTGGVDRLPRSRGIGGREGSINAPTVFNSGFNFRQFWNGRAETLEDQIDGPIHNSIEMNTTWPQVIATLAADKSYRAEFSALYRNGVQPPNVKDAIATFERSLITPNSRFDRFLRGDRTTLNTEEQAGYRLFNEIGCISCHQGVNIGGNMYQKLGIMEDYFAARDHLTEVDLGRFSLTSQEEDRYFFKVPSLRNIATTPPYLHDASAKTLEDAVATMARFQLGKKLTDGDIKKIVAFLRTLTGEYQGRPLE